MSVRTTKAGDNIPTDISPIITELREAKIELLKRAYAVVDPYFSQPFEKLSKERQKADQQFVDFLQLCFEEIGVSRIEYTNMHGPTLAALGRWISGKNVPDLHQRQFLCRKIYTYTLEALTAA
jgi:hypothetical protein